MFSYSYLVYYINFFYSWTLTSEIKNHLNTHLYIIHTRIRSIIYTTNTCTNIKKDTATGVGILEKTCV